MAEPLPRIGTAEPLPRIGTAEPLPRIGMAEPRGVLEKLHCTRVIKGNTLALGQTQSQVEQSLRIIGIRGL